MRIIKNKPGHEVSIQELYNELLRNGYKLAYNNFLINIRKLEKSGMVKSRDIKTYITRKKVKFTGSDYDHN